MSDWETVTPQRRESDGWETIAGGAAVGNPNLQRQGDASRRTKFSAGEGLSAIGGATGIGAVMGAVAPELLTGAAAGVRMLPAPLSNLSVPLTAMSSIARASGRPALAVQGAIGGLVGESAGQGAEAAGAPDWVAEGVRIVGGGAGPEVARALKDALVVVVKTPALSISHFLAKQFGKGVLDTLEDSPEKLSREQLEYIGKLTTEIRGGPKTDKPLQEVGTLMGNTATQLRGQGQAAVNAADNLTANVGRIGGGADKEYADIGNDLRKVIVPRFEQMKATRASEYTQMESQVQDIVKRNESANFFINRLPEYEQIISTLSAELAPGRRSPDVQNGVKKILGQLQNPEVDVFGKPKPISFQAIDDVRRKLGDVFKGNPAEGYDAIDEKMAKNLYGKLSDLQKKFAGGENGPQAKLLQDYANSSETLAAFRSKTGKRATALDRYNDAEYATDASKLPTSYFKTTDGIKALKELTGNDASLTKAAADYADREVRGKSPTQVRSWMNNNTEFLREFPSVYKEVVSYATKSEAAEVATRNATKLVKEIERDANYLLNNTLPAQRAVDLIKSGNTELWGRVAPAMMASPQAKQQTVSAVRQVVAEQANSKETITLFERNIRPFLEKMNLAPKEELDLITSKLQAIVEKNVPEKEKMSMARRILLQSSGSWAASAASRGGVEGYRYMSNQVPE